MVLVIVGGVVALHAMWYRPVQPEKAEPPIEVTPLPIFTGFIEEQPSNAQFSIVVTLSGMSKLESEVQFQNASKPIVLTFEPILTPVRPEQSRKAY